MYVFIMPNLTKWNFYYNQEPDGICRANLVYTPYVSPDNKTFCMKFHRNPEYHNVQLENEQWSEDLLDERFQREVDMYRLAKTTVAVADVIDIDESQREIYIKWPGDDFYMMGYGRSYDDVLPDWREQVKQRYREMWSSGILKFSMHPNSWLVYDDGILRPFNWFFSFERNEADRSIHDYLIQLSDSRQEKLAPILQETGVDIKRKYDLWFLQNICFESFRHNYPSDLVDQLLEIKNEFL